MPKITISILAIEETMIYTLAGPYDIFSAAASCSQQAVPTAPPFLTFTSIVGLNKGPLRCYNGLTIDCQQDLTETGDVDLVVIPSVDFADEPFLQKYPELKTWLINQHKNGAVLASVCAGSFILAETGLLDGKVTTTHWAFAELMQSKFPNVQVHSDMIITEQDNIICAGGATSWQDLVTYLVEKYSTVETAKYIEQFFLLNSHQGGQRPYKQHKSTISHDDLTIEKSQAWIGEHLEAADLLMLTIKQSGLAERTFKRRFKKATTQSPNEYIQNLRIDTAKNLLLTSSATVQDISEQVGLMDGSYFRRLFKRKTSLSAQDFRRQFSTYHHENKVMRVE
jgi:transcriptional regulator GlxA family with amidase domain